MMMLKTERMMMMMMLKTKTMMMKIVMTIMMIENTIVMNNQFHQFHHHCSFNHHTFIKLPTTMIVKMKDMLMKLTVMMMFPMMMKPMKMKLPQRKCLIPMMLVFVMTKAASADCPTLQSSRGEMEIISSRADDNDPDCTPGVTLRNKERCQTFYFNNLDFSIVTQGIEPIYFHTYCLLD